MRDWFLRRIRQVLRLRFTAKLGLALAGANLLAIAVLILVGLPEYGLIPLAVQAAYLTLQVLLMERRLLVAIRRLERKTLEVEGPSLERVEHLQQRILATIETERLETAERFDRLT